MQQDLLREFVDRRGGGVLFLGGHSSLADGVWTGSSLVDLLPVVLPTHKNTFHRAPAYAALTAAGADSLICRLADDPSANAQRWKKLPYLMDYQEAGTPKPGAAVLAEMRAGGSKYPMLITQNYGRGRTAVLATSGTWRWQMSMLLGDTSHRNVLATAAGTGWSRTRRPAASWRRSRTGRFSTMATCNSPLRFATTNISSRRMRKVEVHVLGPGGISSTVEMVPVPDTPGSFQADWTADKAGSYVAEVTARSRHRRVGPRCGYLSAVRRRRREFSHRAKPRPARTPRATDRRALLCPADLGKLAEEIPYSEAGITMRETKTLWNLPDHLPC